MGKDKSLGEMTRARSPHRGGLGRRMFPVTGKQMGGGGHHICPHSVSKHLQQTLHVRCYRRPALGDPPHLVSGETGAPESAGKHTSRPEPARGAQSENAQLQCCTRTQPEWSPPGRKCPIMGWLQQRELRGQMGPTQCSALLPP